MPMLILQVAKNYNADEYNADDSRMKGQNEDEIKVLEKGLDSASIHRKVNESEPR